MEEAVTLAESMDARGHGRGRRTRYRPEHWTPAGVAVTVTAALAAGIFLATIYGRYHYAIDSLAGAAVAATILLLTREAAANGVPSLPSRER